ncbi:fibronectin type III domain-containing protein [Myxococcus sp. AM009]|nr:fibronectin type III domain-containing protein [Myxococcus sp. AM009]NVJ17684.1 fibronectin type III domain-containing protein [Myxococcus sp. AM010]
MNTERFFTSVGVAVRGKDMSSNPPEVLLRTHSGFTRIAGAPYNGGYRFLNVPQGEYYLRSGSAYVLTDERHVEIGRNYLGRQDTAFTSTYHTPLSVSLTNLAPWQQAGGLAYGSRLQFVSGSVDFAGEAYFRNTIPTGTTELETSDTEASNLTNFIPVFEAAKGDGMYVNQLTNVFGKPLPTTGAPLVANSLVRSMHVPPFDFTADGFTPLTISGEMQEVPQSNVSLEWRLGAFTPYASDVHPAAVPRTPSFYIDVSAHGPEEGWIGYSGEVFSFLLPQGASFTLTDRLPYGNPYPAHWRLVGSASYSFRAMEAPPGSGGLLRPLSGFISSTDYVENLVAAPIAPRLTPPRGLAIDGIPASSQRVVGNTSPIISWQPPANGAPTAYRVMLQRYSEEYYTLMGQNLFYLPGTATEVRLPPGILEPDTVYAVRVMAIDSPNAEVTRRPFSTHELLPIYSADTTSSFFSTP